MNLYDIHPDPENAPDYQRHHDTVPELIWERYGNEPEELKKREKALAKDASYAFRYAYAVLEGPFPAGEAAIATVSDYAYHYAKNVLKGPFPAGEAAIAKDTGYAYLYAKCVLNGRFPLGEAIIAKEAYYARLYAKFNPQTS